MNEEMKEYKGRYYRKTCHAYSYDGSVKKWKIHCFWAKARFNQTWICTVLLKFYGCICTRLKILE